MAPDTLSPAVTTARPARAARARTWAWYGGLACTALTAGQQVLLIAGGGGLLPGWQPWPLLLLAAPLLWWGRGRRRAPAARHERLRAVAARVPGRAALALVLAMAVAVWAALQNHEPWIGHEESVYANKARSWADPSTPAAGWGPYRPPGLPLLGSLALRVHADVGALRAVGLLLVLATLTLGYAIAARWTTPRRAALAMLLVLGGLGFLRRMPAFLNDTGSTGLLLVTVFILVRTVENPGPSRALLALPPVVLAAFYLRFGVVGNLCAIALAALLAYGPRAWLAHGRRLAAAGAVILLGLTPHFVYATQVTGWPLGLITWATSQAERSFMGDGLLYYLAIFPYRLAGDLGAVVMFAGLAATVRAARALRAARREHGAPAGPAGPVGPAGPAVRDRRILFLGATAVLVPVLLGFATDGEPRFIYLSVILLTVLGVDALATLADGVARPVLAAVTALALLAVPATAQVVAHGAMPGPMSQHRSTVPVARALAAAGGAPCLLVTGYEPESGWYSGCDAMTYRQYRALDGPPSGTRVSFIRYERGRLQPSAAGVERLVGGRPSEKRRIPTEGVLGTATVVTVG
ncbi:hypothetical protein GCM10010387_29940 [Streptomyces inusitatus]|uniref:Glycosyltransferase n=1 Tax=Streptomyces inusitatus TaxID=68221 RepID=A0A918UTZ5_9ACTN|nr:glycosyltransferase [Streptomyces inusitatus]GGZ33754.1 hypothetical protein GCM10010387_29940 [Streptomyces inusitatus]